MVQKNGRQIDPVQNQNFKQKFEEDPVNKFAAAQQLLRAVESMSIAGISEAVRQMEKFKSAPLELPDTIISNNTARNLTNEVLKHGSLQLKIVPFSIQAGWQIEF